MTTRIFDSQRDKEIISAGGFFCQACLVGKPADDQSRDPRYCLGCYEVLLQEAEALVASGNKHRPSWIPKKEKAEKSATKESIGSTIMSMLNDKKSSMDIIQSVTPSTAIGKRGPKFTELPDDLIRQWTSEGIGARAIATRLENDHHISVSYKTIQRRLQGVLL